MLFKISVQYYNQDRSNTNTVLRTRYLSIESKNENSKMKNWWHLPSEVQYHIFTHLEVHHLLTSVSHVCKSYHNVLNQVCFWIQRLKQCGVEVSSALYHILQNHGNAGEARHCLKVTCAYLEAPRSDFYPEMENGDPWKLREDKFAAACIVLLFRTPKLMFLEIFQNPNTMEYIQLLLKILSTKSCEVRLMDYHTWTDLDSETDDILLKSLTCHDHCICNLTEFQGSLQDLSLLPPTLKKFCLSIKENLHISTNFQDEAFPNLQLLELSISDTFSSIATVQSLSEAVTGVQVKLRFKSWKSPSLSYQDNAPIINLFSQRNMITTFRGSISNVQNLPQTLTQLSISVANDEQANMLPSLQRFVLLTEIDIHIHCRDISPSSLLSTHLLHGESQRIWLFLSDIGDDHVDWTIEVCKKFFSNLKEDDAQSLVLPSSTLTLAGYRRLVKELAAIEGRQEADWEGAVYISSKHITKEMQRDLHLYTLRVLDFYLTRFENDMELSVYIGSDW
ncbi:unnamed protein product [Meganyctiphanes norvegica]|uniref:F-box domain-containing protein n=1 Tax=Meganyctiphanes norvegica TaxID=48144 RepID=A0AAV2QBW3_MEGNR